MRLIDRVRLEAERDYWPLGLFVTVLRRLEEEGYNLNAQPRSTYSPIWSPIDNPKGGSGR